jgi:hypothetical protein
VEEGVVEVPSLEVIEHEDVPGDYAAVGIGEREDGTRVVVSFAPSLAGDALLAGVVTGSRLAGEEAGFSGEVVAVTPQWSTAARRRLGLLKQLPFSVRGAEDRSSAGAVEPDGAPGPMVLTVHGVGARLSNATDRDLFTRAAAALEGLASKHGGSVRGWGESVELVILARRVAELRATDGRIELNTILPQRSSTPLAADDLAEAFDRLEGHLRKRLNDRRTRDGEEGLRARALPLLGAAAKLRAVAAWPLGGADEDALDLVGVDPNGEVVIGAIREELGLSALGQVLDAAVTLQPMLPTVLAGVDAPVRVGSIRLAFAASDIASGVLRALDSLGVGYELFDVRAARGRGLELAARDSGAGEPQRVRETVREAPRREPSAGDSEGGEGRGRRRRGRRPRADRPENEDEAVEAEASTGEETAEASEEPTRSGARRGRRSSGRGRGGRGRGGAGRSEDSDRDGNGNGNGDGNSGGNAAGGDDAVRDASPRKEAPRFDQLSSFDLDDEGASGEGGRPRRRGRSRRRGRRGGTSNGEEASSESDSVQPEPEAGVAVGVDEPQLAEDDDGQLSGLAELPEEATLVIAEPTYDEEEDPGDEADAVEHAATLERERRRLARLAKAEPEPPKPPRRRAVILAHADRDSLVAAIVLARDVRLLEGMWVYPQSDLMTFFRSVTVDQRDDTPLYVVGFSPSPARDVLQAAGLYGDRLVWFDHHDWPPEDAGALRSTLGNDQVHLTPGAGSSLPLVLSTCTRRSRFSDKLVDLATGRFTLHDYERWGRLWWSRLGEIAKKTGEVRSDIDPLLVGRPSDLAREAERAPTPDLPRELEYVSRRDFRLVHFAGYAMVVADVEPDLDLHLAARITRERYGAALSLAYRRGEDLMVLAGDEQAGGRSLDFGAVVEHLNSKLGWVEAHSDADHVARFRIRDLAAHPERLDEVIGTIAMARSILER